MEMLAECIRYDGTSAELDHLVEVQSDTGMKGIAHGADGCSRL